MAIQLKVSPSPDQSFSWESEKTEIRIGRDPACDLVLAGDDHQVVSWRHALVELRPGGAFVADLNSLNGVYVNEKRIQTRALVKTGNQIRIGKNGPLLKITRITLPSAAAPAEKCSVPSKPEPPVVEAQRPVWKRLITAGILSVAVLLFLLAAFRGAGRVMALLSAPGTPETKNNGEVVPETIEPEVVTPVTTPPDPRELARQAHAVLQKNCHRCHGQEGTNEGGLNYVLNRDALVKNDKVKPNQAETSKLVQRIVDQEMPPPGEEPRPSEQELATLKQWIDAGATAFDEQAQRVFVTSEQMLQTIRTDLLAVKRSDDIPFQRYFTLTHLYNAGASDDELETYRHALSKLVNSLSWQKEIVKPRQVDPLKTIYRIDLRDYQWTAAVWDKIIKEDAYAVVRGDRFSKEIVDQTNCTLPITRADWFVFAASRPPLYHDVLQLPKTDHELEKMLLVDVKRNIEEGTAKRAGFTSSGVSSNNRLIERHASSYGAYWKSYDFANSKGRQNLLAHPLGPQEVMPAAYKSETFVHAGGELIFNLPNGLQGYLLADAKGRRIDKGPQDIVTDPKQSDKAVLNGISCMSCHYAGIILKDDEVRKKVTATPAAFPDERLIRRLYVPKDELRKLMDADRQRFLEAVERTTGHAASKAGDPTVNMALRFESELDLPLAAAEAGLEAQAFAAKIRGDTGLQQILGTLLVEGGKVKRDTYKEAFPDIVRVLDLGTYLDPRLP